MINRLRWGGRAWVLLAILCAACESGSNSDEDASMAPVDPDAGASDASRDGGTIPIEPDGGDAFEDGDHEIEVTPVVSGLEHPWSFAFLPGGDILVTERPGRVRIVRDGALVEAPVPGSPAVVAEGQGGLLDIVVAPDFETSRHIYMSYSKAVEGGGSTTAVARARFEGDALVGIDDIFVSNAHGGTRHYGSRLAFDPDGMLYVTIGERGEMERAQDLTDHAGTTVRLLPDGSVPSDNPFVGRADADIKIFSYGHRNAQGMAVHPETGAIWLNEHGPKGGDEINVVGAGKNYGWPLTTYGVDYDDSEITPNTELPGIEPPILHWTPSIAPSGMAFYTGDRFPYFRGNVFVGALAGTHLRRVVLRGTTVVRQQSLLEDRGERIRDVRQGPDGLLYVLTDAEDGALLRLAPREP